MSTPEQPLDTGADLARIALRQAKEAARARGNAPTKKIKRTSFRHARGDGRDPVALLGVVKQLVVDRGWEGGADGGDLVARWRDILGLRAEHWQAKKYDEETGTLTVVCSSDGWATSLRLSGRKLVDEVNEALGKPTLKQIVIHKNTGAGGRDVVPEPAPGGGASPEPAERRRPPNAQPGTDYRAAREGLREERIAAKTEGTTTVAYPDPAFVLKESADAFSEAVAIQEQLAAAAQRSADPRARALARARRERAASVSAPAPRTTSNVA
ncbi:DciA family protein [Streptomyces sp. NPDC088729]|uniref:DciA family protein n=1 Tax=Streptomyces sp. NPDC088729 TaxID=3365876 RepID=UPI00381C0E79